jgi:subtilisin family serine protease
LATLLLACAAALPAAPAGGVVDPGSGLPSPRGVPASRIVVKLNAGYDAAALERLLRGARGSAARALVTRLALHGANAARQGRVSAALPSPRVDAIHVIVVPADADPARLAASLALDPAVAYAEPVRPVRVLGLPAPSAVSAPDDPYYSSSGSWGQGYADLWGLRKIEAAAAWPLADGAGVVVAVIDTGVDYGHEDIAANIWENAGEIADNGVDDDGNGYVDDRRGWDFVGALADSAVADNDPADRFGHGTHVAGTIAAVAGNGLGIVGVAPRSRIMALKGLDDTGSGFDDQLAAAIIYAADNGADVINNSWGGRGSSSVLTDAVNYALSKGCLVLAAAGNEGSDAADFFPASIPGVIAVGATDHLDAQADFSNHGSTVAVAAPGGDSSDAGDPNRASENILSLRAAGTDLYGDGLNVVGTNYYRARGTSMACPHAAGVTALILSRHPGWSQTQVTRALTQSADPVSASRYIGAGRVNARRAVSLARVSDAEVAITSPAAGIAVKGSIPILGTAKDDDFVGYSLFWGRGLYPAEWVRFHSSGRQVDGGVLRAAFDTGILREGRIYTLKLVAVDRRGLRARAFARIEVNNLEVRAPLIGDVLRAGDRIAIEGEVARGRRLVIEHRRCGADCESVAWTTKNVALAGGGRLPVPGALLGTWESSATAGPDYHEVRVSVFTGTGTIRETVPDLFLDPTLRLGWPRRVPWYEDLPAPAPASHGALYLLDAGGRRILTLPSLPARFRRALLFREAGTRTRLIVHGTELAPNARGFTVATAAGERTWYWAGNIDPVPSDVDGDGRLETFTYAGGKPPRILAHRVDGTVLPGWPVEVPGDMAGGNLSAPSIADLDGDGYGEIVVNGGGLFDSGTYDADGLYVYRHDGSLLRFIHLPVTNQTHPETAIADLDHDGSPEIVRRYLDAPEDPFVGEKVVVFDAGGRRLPGWPRVTYDQRDGYGGYQATQYINADSTPVLGDLDGDGRDEVVVATMRNVFAPGYDPARPWDGYTVGGRVHAFRTDGSDLPGFPVDLEGSVVVSPALADVDGDGYREIVVTSGDIFAGTVPPATHVLDRFGRELPGWPVALGDDFFGTPPAVGDPDGDGSLEVVVVAGQGWDSSVAVVDAQGRVQSGWPQTGSGFSIRGAVVSDIDGDGLHEVVVPLSNCVQAWNADGSVCAGFPKVTELSMGDAGPAVADLDGDGRTELVGASTWDFNPSLNDFKHRGSIYVWDLEAASRPNRLDWPMLGHDAAHTGCLP